MALPRGPEVVGQRRRPAADIVHSIDTRAWLLAAVVVLSQAAIAVIFFSLAQQYPLYLLLRHARNASGNSLTREGAAYAGLALSAYAIGSLPAQPFCGWLVDYAGAQRVLRLGLIACLVVIAIMAGVPDLRAFVAGCAVYGVASAVVWPSVFAQVGDSYAENRRGRVLALLNGAEAAGTGAGFAIGALSVDYTSFAAAFALAAGLNGLALVAGLASVRVAARRAAAYGGAVPLSESLAPASPPAVLTPDFVAVCAMLALASMAMSVLVPDLKPYSSEILHIRLSTFTLILALPAAIGALSLIPSGRIADTFGRVAPIIAAASLWPLAMLGLSLTHAVSLVMLWASLAAIAGALGLPAWNALLVDRSSSGRRGLQTGIAGAVQAAALAIGAATGGQAVVRGGVLAPLYLSAPLMLSTAGLALALYHRLSAVSRQRGGGG